MVSNTTKSQRVRPQIDFVDPRSQPHVELRSRGELPHLYKEGASYFVTFRLWDAVEPYCHAGVPAADGALADGTPAPQSEPQSSTRQWIAIQREFNDERLWTDFTLAQRLAQATEPPLTAGSCLLSRDDAATEVEHALLHFHDERYQLVAWCVMPNHAHVAYTALGQHTPEDIHHSWKSFLSHKINRIVARTGTLWERESFDHLIRSIEHYEAYINYIERNPVEAALSRAPEEWKFSSARFVVT